MCVVMVLVKVKPTGCVVYVCFAGCQHPLKFLKLPSSSFFVFPFSFYRSPYLFSLPGPTNHGCFKFAQLALLHVHGLIILTWTRIQIWTWTRIQIWTLDPAGSGTWILNPDLDPGSGSWLPPISTACQDELEGAVPHLLLLLLLLLLSCVGAQRPREPALPRPALPALPALPAAVGDPGQQLCGGRWRRAGEVELGRACRPGRGGVG